MVAGRSGASMDAVTTLRQEQSDEVWLNLDCEEKSTRQSLARANHVANRSADFSRLANPLSDSE